jgi:DNA ligase D-like protein (predicted 3'-phosphoesterase)
MSTLKSYKKKRNFKKTPEPKPKIKKTKKNIFVIQKHLSKRPHFDFRIQIRGALKSWAVPKGIPKSPKEKKLAMLTEDHPLDYANFEGTIPQGEYGAGKVMIWDKGIFENIKKDKKGKEIPILKCFKDGQIEIFLHGKKLDCPFALVRFKDEKSWLLIKMKQKKNERKSKD